MGYKSIITKAGADLFTNAIALGNKIEINRVKVGDGRVPSGQAELTDIIKPVTINTKLGEKKFVPGNPSIMRISVQTLNDGLIQPVYVRELGLYSGNTLVIYAWADTDDPSIIMPVPEEAEYPDTIRLHDIGVFITDQENSLITVSFDIAGLVSYEQMVEYVAQNGGNTEELKEHIESLVYSESGVHGLRIQDNKLEYFDGEAWQESALGGGAGQLETGTSNLKIQVEVIQIESSLNLYGIFVMVQNLTNKTYVIKQTNEIGVIDLKGIAAGEHSISIQNIFPNFVNSVPKTITLEDNESALVEMFITQKGMSGERITYEKSGFWEVPPGIEEVDVWVVGGGAGSGGIGAGGLPDPTNYSGGGSGYAHLYRSVPVLPGDIINVVVGAGGAPFSGGGISYFKDMKYLARGGNTGATIGSGNRTGGAGGTGGGAGATDTYKIAGNGGSNGTDGGNNSGGVAGDMGGSGQRQGLAWNSTTNPYNGLRYAPGGGGGSPTGEAYSTGIGGYGDKGKGGTANKGVHQSGTSGIVIIYPREQKRIRSEQLLNWHNQGLEISVGGVTPNTPDYNQICTISRVGTDNYKLTVNLKPEVFGMGLVGLDVYAIGGGGEPDSAQQSYSSTTVKVGSETLTAAGGARADGGCGGGGSALNNSTKNAGNGGSAGSSGGVSQEGQIGGRGGNVPLIISRNGIKGIGGVNGGGGLYGGGGSGYGANKGGDPKGKYGGGAAPVANTSNKIAGGGGYLSYKRISMLTAITIEITIGLGASSYGSSGGDGVVFIFPVYEGSVLPE